MQPCLCFAVLVLALLGCHSEASVPSTSATTDADAPPRELAAYPRGEWRLSSKLNDSVVWVSHILVSHAGAAPDGRLRQGGWAPDAPATRTPAEAQRIASDLYGKLAADPTQFSALAKQHSDDIVSREHGGSLGGLRATRLPPSFLDALEHLPWGAVSQPIATSLGYHIVMRRSPPPDQALTGRRIVIRYAGTQGPEASERTRDAALALAQSIVAKARAGEPFEALVAQHSEHGDASRAGRMGTWHTTEPSDDALVLEALSRLAIGSTSEPIDSVLGLQIVQRTPTEPAVELAMRSIKLAYDASAADAAINSERSVRQQAQRIAATVHAHPDSLPSWHESLCCRGSTRWIEGHGDPRLTSELEKLAFGEVAAQPIQLAGSFVIVQRIDPGMLPPSVKPLLDMPRADPIDLETTFAAAHKGALDRDVAKAGQLVSNMLPQQSERATVARAFDTLAQRLRDANGPDDHVRAYREAVSELYARLSPSSYSAVIGAVQRWGAMKVLDPASTR